MHHVCKRCGYEWTGKVKTENPVACPRCKSYLWDKDRKTAVVKEPEAPAIEVDNEH